MRYAGFVYLMKAVGTRRFKIGRSSDPDRRLLDLQQSPFEIKLCFAIPSANSALLESFIHGLYEPFRVRGEWFESPNLDEDGCLNFMYFRIEENKKPAFSSIDSEIFTLIVGQNLYRRFQLAPVFYTFIEDLAKQVGCFDQDINKNSFIEKIGVDLCETLFYELTLLLSLEHYFYFYDISDPLVGEQLLGFQKKLLELLTIG
jgi:hypothetical protein